MTTAPARDPARPRKPGAWRPLGLVALAGVLATAATWGIAAAWPDSPTERATVASLVFAPLWTGLALLFVAWRPRAAPGSERRRLFALHRGLGGALVLAAMVVFGSGVGAVMDRALGRWQLVYAAGEPVPPPADQPLDHVLDRLLAERPELVRGELAVHPAGPEQPWIQVDFFGPAQKPVRLDFDARTGDPLAAGRGPLWVVHDLHKRLLTHPLLGETVLGLLGLALALTLLTGLATRRDWWRNLVRRRRAAQPVRMRVHQWLGFFTLPAALAWAWTGAFLGLTLIIVPIVGGAAYGGDRAALMRDVLAVDRPPLDDAAAPRPSLRAALADTCPIVQAHIPDAEVHRLRVRHPGLASGTVRVDLEGEGLLERGTFTRGADGALRDCRAVPAAGLGLQSFMAAIVLHYGEWGPAWLVDLAYILLGAGLYALAWLGGELLARRQERDDPRRAARQRRWLIGVGYGVPLAIVALLLLSRAPALARAEDLAVRVFVAVALLALFVARRFGGAALHRALAAGLCGVPVLGLLLAGATPGPVEFVLLALGLALFGLRPPAR